MPDIYFKDLLATTNINGKLGAAEDTNTAVPGNKFLYSNDGTLTANSDAVVSTQKAVKTYADTIAATKADDSLVVHLAGTETITGDKTLSGTTTFSSLSSSSLLVTDASRHVTATTALPNGVTAVTQSSGDSSTKVATTAYVDSAVGGENLWDRAASTLSPHNVGDNVSLLTGGLKDANVSTAIKLGDSTNTSFSTINKTIVGAVNEVKTGLPTANEKSALDGANSPSVSNVFATMSDISGGGYWSRASSTLSPTTSGDNVGLGTGGLKDSNVTTAVKLGDGSNVSFSTTNKTIIGSVNELNTLKAPDSGVVHLAGTETITGGKTFSGSVNLSSLSASQLLSTDGSKNVTSITSLPNGTTATTQTTGDSTTKVATDAFIGNTITSLRGNPNGLASLDGTGKVPTSQLPISGSLIYKGTWDASGGVYPTPSEANDYWITNVAGTISGTLYNVGDMMIWDGSIWKRVPGGAAILGTGTAIFYVSKDGDDDNDGLSLNYPFLTIQAAVTEAASIGTSGTPALVRVIDAGIYDENVVVSNGSYVNLELGGCTLTSSTGITLDIAGTSVVTGNNIRTTSSSTSDYAIQIEATGSLRLFVANVTSSATNSYAINNISNINPSIIANCGNIGSYQQTLGNSNYSAYIEASTFDIINGIAGRLYITADCITTTLLTNGAEMHLSAASVRGHIYVYSGTLYVDEARNASFMTMYGGNFYGTIGQFNQLLTSGAGYTGTIVLNFDYCTQFIVVNGSGAANVTLNGAGMAGGITANIPSLTGFIDTAADFTVSGTGTISHLSIPNIFGPITITSPAIAYLDPQMIKSATSITGSYLFSESASGIQNDSSVTGATIKDALNTLSAGGAIPDQNKIIYRSASGNDSNNGKAIERAVATLSHAMTLASAEVPTANNQVSIVDLDGDADNGITLVPFVHLFAPNMTLHSTSTIADDSHLLFRGYFNALGGAAFTFSGDGSSPSFITGKYLQNGYINTAASSGINFVNIDYIVGDTSYAVYGATGSHLIIRATKITGLVYADTGSIIDLTGVSDISGCSFVTVTTGSILFPTHRFVSNVNGKTSILDSTEAGTGTGSLVTAGGIYATKKIKAGSDIVSASEVLGNDVASLTNVTAQHSIIAGQDVSTTGYYRYILDGGNSTGYIQGQFPAFSDGVNIMYNMYADPTGSTGTITYPVNYYASRLNVGYSNISCFVGTAYSSNPAVSFAIDGTTTTTTSHFKFDVTDITDASEASASILTSGGLTTTKSMYAGTGISLPTLPGGTRTLLNRYEYYTTTMTFVASSSPTNVPVTISIENIGAKVFFHIPNLTFAGDGLHTGYITTLNSVPDRFRPEILIPRPVLAYTGGGETFSWGTITVTSSGVITIYFTAGLDVDAYFPICPINYTFGTEEITMEWDIEIM